MFAHVHMTTSFGHIVANACDESIRVMTHLLMLISRSTSLFFHLAAHSCWDFWDSFCVWLEGLLVLNTDSSKTIPVLNFSMDGIFIITVTWLHSFSS